jgi:hypothetical protein
VEAGVLESGGKTPNSVVTTGPWAGARDGYIAETAIAIDRLSARIERLERREVALEKQVADLLDHAHQSTRFQALAESLRNSRDYKLDEIIRMIKDLRGRMDAVEGPRAAFNGLTYKTFAAIDGKLAELSLKSAQETVAGRRVRLVGLVALVSAAGFAASAALRLV